jgi:hypothetical protein
MAGYWEIIIPEATTNVVYNPSAELTGNYSAVGGATISIISTRQSYGAKAYYLQTGGSNQGVQLTTATMANAIHYLTFRSSDSDYTWPTITTTVDGANFNVPAVLSTDNGYSLYGVQIPAAQCNGATYVRIVQGSAGASKQAVIDGIQIEQKEYRTTYVDGDQPGCKWNGTPHASTSTRDQFEAGGGRVYNLRDDLGFIVNAQDGTGMPPVTNLSSPLALQPGNLFDGQTIQGRSFSLTGSIIGSTVANFHSQKQALIKALNVNTTTIGKRGQPRIFRYTGAAEEKEIYAVYDGGLEFGLPIGWTEKEFTLG